MFMLQVKCARELEIALDGERIARELETNKVRTSSRANIPKPQPNTYLSTI